MLLLPVINYLSIKKYYNISGSGFRWMTVMNTLDLILLAVPCIIGIGLLSVKKWAWWSLLFYVSALTINNTVALFKNQDVFHLSALVQTLVGISLILFFLRKDISAPYIKMYPRGWRGQKHTPVVIDVILDGTLYKTKDISYARQFRRGRFRTCPTGLYAEWIGCPKNLGDPVAIEMDPVGTRGRASLQGGIVRIDENGVGIAFRNSPHPRPLSISRKDFETEKGDLRRMLSFSQ